MIRKLIFGIIVIFALASCNKSYEKALKSNDPKLMLKVADEQYAAKNWQYAIDLYKRIAGSYAGTKEAEMIAYNSAMANLKDKNFPLAARQFKNFHINFLRSGRAEEALFMSAYSYYKGSPEYNLDQQNTYEAIKELQNFIDVYPTSNKVKEANAYINELQEKLEKKAFEIARAYYVTLKYKAASISFSNFLTDFPDSELRENAYIYLVRASSQLALKSIFSKKQLRLQEALTDYRLFAKNFPNSEYLKEANRWKERVEKEQISHEKNMALINAEK